MSYKCLNLMALCGCLFSSTTFAQSGGELTLEQIFSSADFRLARFGPARWVDDGTGYTILEPAALGEGTDIVRYETRSGKRAVLVSAARLIPRDGSTPMKIDDYQWSADKRRLLIFTNTKKVWRRNTRGDYWVLDLAHDKLHQLGGDAGPSSLMFAKFSPDGTRVGYVRDRDLYVEDLRTGKIVGVTADGSQTTVNGTSDWVYEEEFGLRDGFRWSPDGTKIAYWQFDTEGVGTIYMINNTQGQYSQLVPLQYPKVGTTNSACRVGVVASNGGPTTWLAIAGDPRNHYIPRMEWAAGSEQVVVQQMNRLQNTNRVMLGNAQQGSVQTILVERDDAWIDIHDDLKWLDGGTHFTWLSERDGWRHLYVVSRDGKDIRLLTPGPFDIVRIVTIDDKGGYVYFIASPDDPTRRYLYRVPLDGKGTMERLTPMEQPGVHGYQVSPGGQWAFHTRSTFETPPVVSLVSLPEHEVVRVLADNGMVRDKVNTLARTPVAFFRVSIEAGVALDAWVMKPPGFDPAKKYPLFFYVYGEPAGQTVMDRWGGQRYLWHLKLTQLG